MAISILVSSSFILANLTLEELFSSSLSQNFDNDILTNFFNFETLYFLQKVSHAELLPEP